MDPKVATNAGFVRRFREEVQAVAALDHHGVVMVLDHGVIDANAAAMSEKLAVGCPWLAMEFCGGGTLKDLHRTLPWSAIKTILLATLDALGHAHARGVIHRDLKPANVLIGTRRDTRAGLKLSDFGIAGAVDGPDDIGGSDAIMGTPRFMAPEQITGAWRDQGPWTDLYSLGCLTHWLVAGKTPFKGVNIPATLVMHMHSPPPKLEAAMPLPAALDAWVAQLLAKRPSERFQCAADASFALASMEDPPEDSVKLDALGEDFQNTLDLTAMSLGHGWRLA
jgi:serine/threonine-protein kinase